MNANELAEAMEIRASIRRNATSRKSVQEGASDRLADQLEQAAAMLRQQAKELDEAGHMIGVLREQLQEEIQARADALDDLNSRMMKFMKSYNEMAYKLEEVGGAYTHPVKELDEQYEKGFKAGKEEGWKAHKFHHPVKEQDTDCQYCKQGCIRCDARKQLTDEEIMEVATINLGHSMGLLNWMGFARAILRKANEK